MDQVPHSLDDEHTAINNSVIPLACPGQGVTRENQ